MHRSTLRRTVLLVAAFALALGGVAVGSSNREADGLPRAAQELRAEGSGSSTAADKDFREPAEGIEHGGAGGEAAEQMTAQEQWAQARTAPGIVAPGGYSDAYAALTGLSATGGDWQEITNLPYDADDPDYRDYYSNSGGGSGLVTGRITALAADNHGDVYAGGADGGVWRSTTGGGNWTPIADNLPSLSSGDLQLDDQGRLWYATGEANTGGTSYVGTGVYVLDDPTSGTFSPDDRVGGDELESKTINALRFTEDKVWIATLRGVWWHSLDADHRSDQWTQSFAPNPSYLPGGANADNANAAYKNIVNDVAIDPNDADHLIAAVGWRSGDAYNGFYETWDGGDTWMKVNLKGGLDKNDIGNATFAWAADGSRLYVMNQSPKRIQSFAAIPMTYLDGIYVSKTGSLDGPWTRIATADKLGAASGGSALTKNYGVGYRPGIQSWYNQFLIVDPGNPDHVIAGLEEVYETTDGGSHWTTIGPYWNFYFRCWAPDAVYPPNGDPNRCPQTTHPDQHSVAIGSMVGGDPYLVVGNDGGVYKRPLDGETNRNGNATDWTDLNDGTIDALQYYGMGIGALPEELPPDMGQPDETRTSVLVSGGMQDNGGSLLRPGAEKMVSNFGGDGGDVLVDPDNGCNIVQEYVYLSLELTQTCAHPDSLDAFLDPSKASTFDVAPPDINARFIAPFAANSADIDEWVAGGNSLWFQDQGFDIRSGSEWQKIHTFSSPVRVATATAFTGDTIIAGWCGPCNNAGFARGIVVLHRDGDTWSVANTIDASDDTIPNRYVGSVAVDPNDAQHLFIGLNGFSRRFTEGPGAGIGHIYESTNGGNSWDLVDAGSFPDVPVNSVRVLPTGGTVVGTDLGVVYRAPGSSNWSRLGDNFPTTVAMDVEYSATDNMVYVATHGRGIWRINNPDSGSVS